jgi:hypothetical protein
VLTLPDVLAALPGVVALALSLLTAPLTLASCALLDFALLSELDPPSAELSEAEAPDEGEVVPLTPTLPEAEIELVSLDLFSPGDFELSALDLEVSALDFELSLLKAELELELEMDGLIVKDEFPEVESVLEDFPDE